ncbi:MAG: hypothetical protein IT205_02670 [Fimbriimonadaceae bacterium]|nr:hypothetical protein [Fimbriimonadaceae bacterium]
MVNALGRSNKPRTSRETGLLTGAAVIVMALGFLVLRPKAELPEVVAEKVLLASFSGDADTLLAYQHEHEKQYLKLSRNQVKQLLYYINTVLLRDTRIVGEPVRLSQGSRQGIAYVTIAKGGRQSKFDLVADRTDLGPKVCISNVVMQALSVRAVHEGKSAEEIDWRVHRTAMAEVIADHLAELENCGFTGFVSNDPDSRLVPLSRYVATRGGVQSLR